ncbi:hypothetical protein BDR03DRAFT_867796, partial [Suillus americanus]
GVSFMIDKMALEEMVIHFGKYNMIGGLCWKHSNLIDPVLCTYNSAVRIAYKIHNQEVHLGKEVTVIGVACFGKDDLYPMLVAPTCKTHLPWMEMQLAVLQVIGYSSRNHSPQIHYYSLHYSFAMDGDATCCAAGHRLFIKKPLTSDSLLFATLSDMPSLNTLTGDNKVTLDSDFKHIFKHMCFFCFW